MKVSHLNSAQGSFTKKTENETTQQLRSFRVMMILIPIIYFLLFAVLTEGTTIEVEGLKGGSVSFLCSHKFAKQLNKYFCKDPCQTGGTILATVAPGKRTQSGRITLEDSGVGTFTVTMRQLRLSDSQTYYCGVERPGWMDTYTTIRLTVRDVPSTVVPKETTTPTLDASSTPTHRNTGVATQFTSETSSTVLENLSTESNVTFTPEQSSRKNMALHGCLGLAVTITVFVLVTCIWRKRAEISKPQSTVASNNDVTNAYESEVNCEYDDIGIIKNSFQTVSKGMAGSSQRPLEVSARSSREAASRHIYENVSFLKSPATAKCSPTYIKPLVNPKTKRVRAGPAGGHTHKPAGMPCKTAVRPAVHTTQ